MRLTSVPFALAEVVRMPSAQLNYYKHHQHRQGGPAPHKHSIQLLTGEACGQGSLPAARNIDVAIALLIVHHPGMMNFGPAPMSKIFQTVCLLNNVPAKKIYINIKSLWDNHFVYCEAVTRQGTFWLV